jgi:hypothetical protein
MYIFAFAHTYKDKNYAASSGELTPKEIRKEIKFVGKPIFKHIMNLVNKIDIHGLSNRDNRDYK